MTAEEVIRAVHDDLGRPTDVEPFDRDGNLEPGANYEYYMGLVNRGVAAVASWKDKLSGRQFRYKEAFQSFFVKNEVIEGESVGGGTESSFRTQVPAGGGVYLGWLVEVGGEVRTCVDYTNTGIVTVERPFSREVEADTPYKLRAGFVELPPNQTIVEVLQVSSMDENRGVDVGMRGDLFLATRGQLGRPTQWYRGGQRVWFNFVPDEEMWWRLEAYCLPPVVTNPHGEIPLPPQMHNGVVLWMTSKGFGRMQEMNGKYSYGRDFEEFMRSTKSSEDVSGELDNAERLTVEVQ